MRFISLELKLCSFFQLLNIKLSHFEKHLKKSMVCLIGGEGGYVAKPAAVLKIPPSDKLLYALLKLLFIVLWCVYLYKKSLFIKLRNNCFKCGYCTCVLYYLGSNVNNYYSVSVPCVLFL